MERKKLLKKINTDRSSGIKHKSLAIKRCGKLLHKLYKIVEDKMNYPDVNQIFRNNLTLCCSASNCFSVTKKQLQKILLKKQG